MEKYVVLYATEDGLYINQVTKEELLNSITPDEDGETDYGHIDEVKFLTEMPKNSKWYEYEKNSLLILKGDVVVPKPKTVVTQYDI